jgi:hypothetical protein
MLIKQKTMPLPSYNTVQQVFALNIFSNYASSKKGTAADLQADLSKILNALLANQRMQKLIGSWQVVWGPVVGSYGKDAVKQVASNALYVAKNDNGMYVVATAGTNPISNYGWFTEDFDVQSMVVWPGFDEKDPTAPRISNGTNTGLNHLLNMQYHGITLSTFLTNTFAKSNTSQQLIVTGHSLGGALSATLALRLLNTQSQWNPGLNVVVSALSSAGATPGNLAFSNYYSTQLGNRTLRFWNKLDPVPHGWQPHMLESVPFLYYPYFSPNILLQSLVSLALKRSFQGTLPYPGGGPYTQLLPQIPPLPGQVNLALTQPISAAQVMTFLADMELKKILNKLGINGLIATTIITISNSIIHHFDDSTTADDAIDWMRHELEKIFGRNDYLKHLFRILEALLKQAEGLLLFVAQLGYQHVSSYYDLMDLKNFKNVSDYIINDLVGNKKLDRFYQNISEKLCTPAEGTKLLSASLNNQLQYILTSEFLEQGNFPSMPKGISEPSPL